MSSSINTTSDSPNSAERQPPSRAEMAHELANLLDGSMRNVNLVRSFLTEQAGSSEPTDADVTQRLQTAEQGMRQMATLLRQWLQAGNQASVTEPSDAGAAVTLGESVDIAIGLLKPIADQHGIRLTHAIASVMAALPDRSLHQVIVNALRNAIEAIAQSERKIDLPRVELVIQRERNHVLIEINDNGPGIPAELLDQHGDCRFGETSKPDGHGIGLNVCRDIAETLGGTVRLTNRAPRGATFTMRFPMTALPDTTANG